jgi:hypothetical protein
MTRAVHTEAITAGLMFVAIAVSLAKPWMALEGTATALGAVLEVALNRLLDGDPQGAFEALFAVT